MFKEIFKIILLENVIYLNETSSIKLIDLYSVYQSLFYKLIIHETYILSLE